MKFKINCNDDSVVIEANTIEEVRKIALQETTRRGWEQDDCWSERLED
jgi:hypothetical protein